MDDNYAGVVQGNEVHFPQYEYKAIKYGNGKIGKFLGDLAGRAIIPAAAAYAAHKLGVPHEYLMLAPGLLLVPPVFRAGRKLGDICGKIGAFVGKQLPCDYVKGTITNIREKDMDKRLEQIADECIEDGFHKVQYKRIDDVIVPMD